MQINDPMTCIRQLIERLDHIEGLIEGLVADGEGEPFPFEVGDLVKHRRWVGTMEPFEVTAIGLEKFLGRYRGGDEITQVISDDWYKVGHV